MEITLQISGDIQLLERLGLLSGSLNNFNKEMSKIGDLLVSYMGNQVFASEGTVFGNRWNSLNDTYATIKAKKYPGRGILVATGAMKDGYYAVSTDLAVTLMNRQDYFQYHQEGTDKMPQRLLMAFNETIINSIEQVIKDGITERINSI